MNGTVDGGDVHRLDARWSIAGALVLASSGWVFWAAVAPIADAASAVLVPALFVVAGVLGPLWGAARFTWRMLAGIGILHLVALTFSAAALRGGGVGPHVVSQVLFVAGFALLVPLALGYPNGHTPRWSWWLVAVTVLIPPVDSMAGPTPTVLSATDAAGAAVQLGPIAPVLPPAIAQMAAIVFALPAAAVVVAIVRLVRGDRELRGRLTLPLLALAAFALLIAASLLLPTAAAPVATILFLLASPLVPVALVAGSRPLSKPLDELPRPGTIRDDGRLAALSPRERDVLALMADGASNSAIASTLHISLSAVEKHTTAIFTKLGLDIEPRTHRRVSAVVAYLRAMS